MGHDLTDAELAAHLRRRAAAAPTPSPTSFVAAVAGDAGGLRPNRRGIVRTAVALTVLGLVGVLAIQALPGSLRQPTSIATRSPTSTATPSAIQTPVDTPMTAEVDCSGEPEDRATVLDTTGLVRGCVGGQMNGFADHPEIFNLLDDRTTVVLAAPMSLCFGPVTLSLVTAQAKRFTASMQEGEEPGCFVPTDVDPVFRTVALKFDRPMDVSAFTVNGWSLADEPPLPPLSRSDQDTNGDFTLTLSAGRSQYPADEPIADIRATLVYVGSQDTIDLTGGSELIEPWQLEQLDGPIDQSGASRAPCRGYTMQKNVPVEATFGKSGAYSQKDPLFSFWDAYFADPELRLPPGTWRISVGAHFSETSCDGQIGLSGSIVIRTVEQSTPSPSPVPLAPTLACPADDADQLPIYAVVHDQTGLVESCESVANSTTVTDIHVANSAGDQTTLRVLWAGPVCDKKFEFQLYGTAAGYGLDGQLGSAVCFAIYADFDYEIRLHLREPIEASTVTPTMTYLHATPSP